MLHNCGMSTDDVQTNLRLPAKLKDRLQEIAKASGRTLTAEVVHRLEASLGQPTSMNRPEADSEVWDQLRSLRAQENRLTAHRASLQSLRDDLVANAPRDADGNFTTEARQQIWRIGSDVYQTESELHALNKRLDEVYSRASGIAPGAGRSWT
jgi:cytochrome c556